MILLLIEYENKAEGDTTVFNKALAENAKTKRKRKVKI